MKIRAEVQKLREEIIKNRRHLHRHPELAFKEIETTKYVAAALKSYGNIEVEVVKCGAEQNYCGVIGTIRGRNLHPLIALRADMDGLPILEDSKEEYVSQNKGVMHACGHDGHMSSLLAAAKIIASPEFLGRMQGSVRLIFQPAEEGLGGAPEMIKAGCLKDVDEVYGIHLWNVSKTGLVGVTSGPIMAASDSWELKVIGRGGHGAMPESTRDAIVAASHFVVAVQTIVSRNVSPLDTAVVSVGKFESGYNYNVIADIASLKGTARTFRKDTQKMIVRRMKEIAAGLEITFDVKCKFEYNFGYPPTVNHPAQTEKVRRAVSKIVGERQTVDGVRTCGAEDFSYYLEERPGCFFFVGSNPRNDDTIVPHHRSDFDINEDALLISASAFVQLVEELTTANNHSRM
eukprot:TRINITY_DN5868_c0_g1_i1.p1 TRINITY_DN5868_c0_g1~~TRINITY_DN5868_c0_g1_i1.p1  ORF type:complete len:403 (+),score=67.29 TRINITY_DN5868_c0_g1_i1:668-1876(+)